ncbi:hypothetical protein OV203_12105 [Nannocystis sp. ILAH1]|uniref:hypothetical protein n=1 Tax=unclassified Nannocystis TaxID=2627009 RepID=UPI00226EC5D0|nr:MULTISPECIES: hypothetical protein [unclassified Nannocystis]MCY0987872.1 hypothetical protein [Nannocystis sp. ILAH1]MCY1070323.1 hypothetical protein [Nannocystis sp. RBIL2]
MPKLRNIGAPSTGVVPVVGVELVASVAVAFELVSSSVSEVGGLFVVAGFVVGAVVAEV